MHVKDAGGSLVVHAFGAYFGIAVAFGMGVKAKQIPSEHRNTTYFRWISLQIFISLLLIETMYISCGQADKIKCLPSA